MLESRKMLHQSLAGIRVLDLTHLFPGPLATLMLRDLGADVIKVEAPDGEWTRYIPPFHSNLGTTFLQFNRGKRSLTLNLKFEEGKAILRKLIEQSDVLVESFRPRVMRRLELDYYKVKYVNPSLIYCSISGFGQFVSDSEKPAHDLNFASLSGLLAPVLHSAVTMPRIQVADTFGAYQAVAAILAALFQRSQTGNGQHLDISLLDGAFFTMIHNAAEHLTGAEHSYDHFSLTGKLACYNIYQTLGGRHIAIALLEPKFWRRFCEITDLHEYINRQLDPDQAPLITALNNLFIKKTLHEWLAFFQEEDLCITPVNTMTEAAQMPQIRERNLLLDVEYPGGVLQQMKTPFVAEVATDRAPNLGEHSIKILTELGYSAEEIESLKSKGVL